MADLKEEPRPKTTDGSAQTKAVAPRATARQPASQISPYNLMRGFAREFDRAVEDFGLATGMHLPGFLSRGRERLRREIETVPAEWAPRIDVLEREGQFVVRADLPGLTKDDITLEVSDEQLTIHGERKFEKKEEREGCCYSERSYGSFYRAIPLPEGAQTSKATAEFRNGVLEVTVPAPQRTDRKPQRVEIRDSK